MQGSRSTGNVLVLVISVLALSFLVFLPSISSAQEEIYGIKFGTAGTFAEFHGFINARYFDFERESDQGRNDGTSTFDVHNLYIAALAKIHPKVSIFGEVEYEHTGKEGNMDIFVDRAFIDWRAIDQYLTLRIGSFNPPVGYELAEYVAPVRKFESRPIFVAETLFDEWVDTGLWGRGQLKSPAGGILYDLSVVNGPEGLTKGDQQNRDKNSDRTILGRIAFAPNIGDLGYTEIGASYVNGKYDLAAEREFKVFDIDARIQIMGLDLRGEYADRSGDDDTTNNISADSTGWYIQASYKMLQGRNLINYIEPKIRYDVSDVDAQGSKTIENDITVDDKFSRITVGINYSPYPHFLFKTEYQFIDEDKADLDNDGFMISAVVDF
ncbi:MAG TPA: porin [Nitrospiria bacterium]|nr:porin [Nitrospiria bacterium]